VAPGANTGRALTDGREAAVEEGRDEGADDGPNNAEKVGARCLYRDSVVVDWLSDGADAGVGRRVAHHDGVDAEVAVVVIAIALAALGDEALHARAHVGREVPVVVVEGERLADDLERLGLGHGVDLVEDVLALAVRRELLEERVWDLVADAAGRRGVLLVVLLRGRRGRGAIVVENVVDGEDLARHGAAVCGGGSGGGSGGGGCLCIHAHIVDFVYRALVRGRAP
jgi:hypothetical protein